MDNDDLQDRSSTDSYKAGVQLGMLYADVKSYLTAAGRDEDDTELKAFLVLLEALADVPEAADAIAKARTAWDEH